MTLILHNPRCSKSRTTLKLLNEKGIEPEIVQYLKTPPTKSELAEIIQKLDIAPKTLIRFKERTASDLGLSPSDTRPDAEWLQLMSDNPVLIERPIVVHGEKAAIGRPPENILKMFA